MTLIWIDLDRFHVVQSKNESILLVFPMLTRKKSMMEFQKSLSYPEGFFDIVWGSFLLL